MTQTEARLEYKDFHEYYSANIAPILAQFEPQRKIKQMEQGILSTISFALVCGVLLFLIIGAIYDIDLNVGYNRLIGPFCFFLGMLGVWGVIGATLVGKNFENMVKKNVFETLLKFFGDFKWTSKEKISEDLIKKSKLLVDFNIFQADDFFEGCYKNTKVIISECKMMQGSGRVVAPVFAGILIKLDLEKKQKSPIVIAEPGNPLLINVNSTIAYMNPISLDDEEFNELFNVYAEDELEARYTVNRSLMHNLKELKRKDYQRSIKVSFVDNFMLIAIPNKIDMFKLADLRKPINDSNQMQELFEQFVAILSIIDILKLNLEQR